MQTTIIKESIGLDISMSDFSVSFLSMRSDLLVVVKGSRTFANNQMGYVSFVQWV